MSDWRPESMQFAQESDSDWDRFTLAQFVPSPVLASAMVDPYPRQLWRLPNRLGKTRHACAKGAQAMIDNPGSRWRFVGPNRTQVQHVMGRYLNQFLQPYLSPGSYYTIGKGWNTLTIRLANGSIGQLRSYEDRVDTHAGDELDGVVLDEPPPRPIFTENVARTMSRQGQVLLTLTPVGRPVEWLREMVEMDGSPWREVHAVFSQENAPWYSEAQVEGWLETMRASPWDWPQRVEGAWEGYETGRTFTGFTDECIIETEPPGRVKLALGFDHGEGVGHEVCILVAYEGTRVWIIDEYQNEGPTTSDEDAAFVLDMIYSHGLDPRQIDLAVGDINSAGKTYAGWSVNQVLEQAMARKLDRRTPPFRILNADKTPGTKDWGQRCINSAFRRGDMRIHKRCKNGIKSLQGWQGSTRGDEDGKLAHWPDALRYVLIAILGADRVYAELRFL